MACFQYPGTPRPKDSSAFLDPCALDWDDVQPTCFPPGKWCTSIIRSTTICSGKLTLMCKQVVQSHGFTSERRIATMSAQWRSCLFVTNRAHFLLCIPAMRPICDVCNLYRRHELSWQCQLRCEHRLHVVIEHIENHVTKSFTAYDKIGYTHIHVAQITFPDYGGGTERT